MSRAEYSVTEQRIIELFARVLRRVAASPAAVPSDGKVVPFRRREAPRAGRISGR